MSLKIKNENGFNYIEKGEGDVLLLLHGLFGALSNFKDVVRDFSGTHKVIIPMLPLLTSALGKTSVQGMVDYLHAFIRYKQLDDITLLGNSLGGHIALMYTLQHPDKVKAIILTGSSGLFESSLGDTYPRKGDYEYVKAKAEYTFYNPALATKELVDEVYETVNDRNKALRIIYMAKSAMRNNLRKELHKINVPVLLIWGKNDRITPPFVGQEFEQLLPNARLELLDECGHAPMMEQPEQFNRLLKEFLNQIKVEV